MVVVFFTLTDRASTVPSNIRGCQSGTWSQGGTKVNGSHRRDNPLLTPTGIQIATKSNATLQAMAPTNIKTVHQTFLLHIESSLDRLGLLLSPTHDQRSQQQIGQITLLLLYTVQYTVLLVDRLCGGDRTSNAVHVFVRTTLIGI